MRLRTIAWMFYATLALLGVSLQTARMDTRGCRTVITLREDRE